MQTITILASGIGFGVYLPALVLFKQLEAQNIATELLLVETYFKDEKKASLQKNQEAFHKNIKVAKAAMRLSLTHQIHNFDETALQELFLFWKKQKKQNFLVVSGGWQPILEQYQHHYVPYKLNLYCIHMDCIIAPSWKKFNLPADCTRWLLGEEDTPISYALTIDGKEPIPFIEREQRILVQGGGWGIGIEQSKIDLLKDTMYQVDMITTIPEKLQTTAISRLFYTNGWQTWSSKELCFPPLYAGDAKKNLNVLNEHYVYRIAKNTMGMISKGGGGSLIDSFSGAIPMIFTTSIAKHEEENANKWIRYGFGITFEQWKEANFSKELLYECHNNLIKSRKQTRNICDDIVEWRNNNKTT